MSYMQYYILLYIAINCNSTILGYSPGSVVVSASCRQCGSRLLIKKKKILLISYAQPRKSVNEPVASLHGRKWITYNNIGETFMSSTVQQLEDSWRRADHINRSGTNTMLQIALHSAIRNKIILAILFAIQIAILMALAIRLQSNTLSIVLSTHSTR